MTGFLIDPNAPDQLAQKLWELLNNPSLVPRIGNAARLFAEKNLNPQRFLDKFWAACG